VKRRHFLVAAAGAIGTSGCGGQNLRLERRGNQMSADQSRNIVNLMIEEIQNKKHIELCDELFSDAFVNHTPVGGISNDRAGMRQLFSGTHIGFPDGRISIEDQIAEGGRVWTRKTFRGTHAGLFAGVAPTGKVISYQVVDILVVRGGKITAHWGVVDRLDLAEQLGLVQRRTP
jgi:predicted ester cyclase